MLDPRDLAGAYRQIAPAEIVAPDGSVLKTESAATAHLIYTAEGYFSFVVAPDDRPKLPGPDSPDLNGVPDEALRGAVTDLFVLTGRYELGDGEMDHFVEFSLNPNFNGGVIHRIVHLGDDGADLTLGFLVDDGNRRRVKFERLP